MTWLRRGQGSSGHVRGAEGSIPSQHNKPHAGGMPSQLPPAWLCVSAPPLLQLVMRCLLVWVTFFFLIALCLPHLQTLAWTMAADIVQGCFGHLFVPSIIPHRTGPGVCV